MALLTVQSISKAGLADAVGALAAAAAAGDSTANYSGILIVMNNADASAHTLTVAAPVAYKDCGNLGSLAVSPLTLIVAAGDTGFLAIPTGYQAASGDLEWTYDAETSVSVGVFSIAP